LLPARIIWVLGFGLNGYGLVYFGLRARVLCPVLPSPFHPSSSTSTPSSPTRVSSPEAMRGDGTSSRSSSSHASEGYATSATSMSCSGSLMSTSPTGRSPHRCSRGVSPLPSRTSWSWSPSSPLNPPVLGRASCHPGSRPRPSSICCRCPPPGHQNRLGPGPLMGGTIV
jgi:hypothetical protein